MEETVSENEHGDLSLSQRYRVEKFADNFMIQFNFSQDLDFKIYLSQCVESYVEKKIECRLSEHQNATDHVVRKCQSKEDLDNFQLEMEKLDSFKSINKITGCKPKCQTERFELRQTWSIARNKSTLSQFLF